MLSSYINVYNTCLLILRRKGYALNFEKSDTTETWKAEKGSFEFTGDNPIELLGLIGIYGELDPVNDSEYWWRIEGPDLMAELCPDQLTERGCAGCALAPRVIAGRLKLPTQRLSRFSKEHL
jgi:hypothetical protein